MFKTYSQVNAEITTFISPLYHSYAGELEFSASLVSKANSFKCAFLAGTSI